MVLLDTNKIYEIGSEISDLMIRNKLINENELTINVDEESFKRIDEDLFYRNKCEESNEFTPSETSITIKFPYFTLKIKKEH